MSGKLTTWLVAGASLLGVFGCSSRPAPRDYMKENVARWNAQLEEAGGTFEAWEQKVKPYHDDVRKALEDRPPSISGIIGLEDTLFFRRSLEVLVCGDYAKQTGGKYPLPAIVDFHEQLKSRGIHLLFCPIPVKGAVFPDRLSENAPPKTGPYANPWTYKLFLELAAEGVECVDLMPALLAARDEPGEELYMPLDTHYSPRGMEVVADVFAERIRNYEWYRNPKPTWKRAAYTTQDAPFKRRGDIVAMLKASERRKYRPMELVGKQVVGPDGELYKDDKTSPVMFLGDSYAGVFHFQDCKNAGITAHIALRVGMPLDLVLGLGMGPEVRKKVARRGKDGLTGKRLVIWALSERDLYNYRSPWGIIPMP